MKLLQTSKNFMKETFRQAYYSQGEKRNPYFKEKCAHTRKISRDRITEKLCCIKLETRVISCGEMKLSIHLERKGELILQINVKECNSIFLSAFFTKPSSINLC